MVRIAIGLLIVTAGACVPRDATEPRGNGCDDPTRVFTDPGKATAAVPDLIRDLDAGQADGGAPQAVPVLRQVPAPGTRLPAGTHVVEIFEEGVETPRCRQTLLVDLDPDSAALPFFAYIPAGTDGEAELGAVPAVELGELVDELGNPIELSITVDNQLVDGTSLQSVAALYAVPGFHITRLIFRDSYGRVATLAFPEEFKRLIEQGLSFVGGVRGIAEGCVCGVTRRRIDKKDCKNPEKSNGDGDEDYECQAQNLLRFSSEVYDYRFYPDTQSSTNNGFDKTAFEITCIKDRRLIAQCVECCPKPVIVTTVDAHIDGIKALADNQDDRAFFEVVVASSGINSFVMRSSVASGLRKYKLERGVTITGNGGVGATDQEGNANAGIEGSKSTKESYEGEGIGWQSKSALGPTLITGAAETCRADNVLSVAFNADLYAKNSFIFFFTYDAAQAQLEGTAGSFYSNVTFRCDGMLPKVNP